MGHVTKVRQEDGTLKLVVRYFWRLHEREDFETAFQNHQDEGNLLGRTDFLTNSILWQPVDEQHIIHACKVLAWKAFQRGDITKGKLANFNVLSTNIMMLKYWTIFLNINCS
jgi:hypothetical protein